MTEWLRVSILVKFIIYWFTIDMWLMNFFHQIIGQMMDADKMKVQYDRLFTRLLDWIRAKVTELEDRNFPNSLEGIQKELLKFKQYRTIEKPPKYVYYYITNY